MTHHAKASSAGSTEAGDNSRGLLRRAFATRAYSSGSKGSGAPSRRRLGAMIAGLAIIALLASAATASAKTFNVLEPVTQISYNSVHAEAIVSTDEGCFCFFSYELSTDGGTTWQPWATSLIFGPAEEKPLPVELAGLKGGTTYKLRFQMNGVEALEIREFTTLAVEPPTIVATDNASSVFSASASASGKVKRPANPDPAFDVTACRFEYVTAAQFTATGFTGAGRNRLRRASVTEPNAEKTVSAELTGLSPSTTYHLRLAAEDTGPNAATKEAAATFTTAAKVAGPTIIATNDATELKINGGNASAKFSGEVQRPAGNDPALDVTCRFEIRQDEQFNNAPSEDSPALAKHPASRTRSPRPAAIPKANSQSAQRFSALSNPESPTSFASLRRMAPASSSKKQQTPSPRSRRRFPVLHRQPGHRSATPRLKSRAPIESRGRRHQR